MGRCSLTEVFDPVVKGRIVKQSRNIIKLNVYYKWNTLTNQTEDITNDSINTIKPLELQ